MDTFSSATQLEKRIVLSATMKKIPLGGAFELLPLCNMNCKMCFLRLTPSEMASQGVLRTADEWLSLATQAKDAGLLFLLLTGGEPFLYPEFVKLYKGLCELGLIITINSNGTLITEEIADILAAHKPRRVNITLYGSSDEIYGRLCGNPNGFTQTVNAVRMLRERGVDVKLNGSMTQYNYEDLPEIQRVAKELDVPLEVDTYMFPSCRKGSIPFDMSSRLDPASAAEGYMKAKESELPPVVFENTLKHMAECYERCKESSKSMDMASEGEPMPCRAGLSSFWINWKGNMTPCVFMEDPAISVFEQGFNASWEYIKEERNKLFLPPKCKICEMRDSCSVCVAAVRTETGGMKDAPEYVCEYTKNRLKLAYDLKNA